MNYTKVHFQTVLKAWEKDNSGIYFDKVPLSLPAEKKLAQQGVQMMKAEPFELEEVEPVALILPDGDAGDSSTAPADTDSDYELAKQLQEQLNA